MDRHHILLIIHLISATIWVGGHLILLLGFLPKALKHKNFDFIFIDAAKGQYKKFFEDSYKLPLH